ncbi:hypothetical protein Y032_0351g3240 [Ancylostoma ceylanicum]|uniref:Leishmanolysin-like peptidase n=1 Tax=Ancylostoma ceylanicum TaxID=53326 RepID=A0A016RXQ6_9BILA|nr:hypothetical protein Y032_0351g3240 [Ancylostoma ceylanicum]
MITPTLLALLHSAVFACDYRPPSDENLTTAITEYPEGNRPKRDVPTWDWIRIETEYDPAFNLLTEEKQEVLEDLITTARDYFETTIKVQRLASIQLAPSCKLNKGVIDVKNNLIRCDYDCEKRCGRAIASTRASFFSECVCKGDSCETVQGRWGGTLRNADFVLFVTAISVDCGGSTLAYAAHCALDKETRRPIAGFVNVCPEAFNRMKASEISQWEATIKHELIHAFVFSTSLFPKFPLAKGNPKKIGPMVVVPGVIEQFTRLDWETAEGITPHTVFMMVTPKVREEARNFFKCPDLEGAEIENQGGVGTAGCHWEKRVFEVESTCCVFKTKRNHEYSERRWS